MVNYTLEQLEGFNKGQLREAMRAANLPYAGMNNDGMKDALKAHLESQQLADLGEALPGSVQEQSVAEAIAQDATSEVPAAVLVEEPVVVQPTDVVPQELATAPQPVELPVVVAPQPTAPPTRSKVQKERPEKNGIKKPSDGTICARIWQWCDEQVTAGGMPTAKDLRAALTSVDNTTCTVQFYR